MAELQHSSARLGMTLYLGEVDGEVTTASVSLSSISADATADVLDGLVAVVSELLAYSVSAVKLYLTQVLVSDSE